MLALAGPTTLLSLSTIDQGEYFYLDLTVTIYTHMKSTWKGAMGGYLGMVVRTELLHSSAW